MYNAFWCWNPCAKLKKHQSIFVKPYIYGISPCAFFIYHSHIFILLLLLPHLDIMNRFQEFCLLFTLLLLLFSPRSIHGIRITGFPSPSSAKRRRTQQQVFHFRPSVTSGPSKPKENYYESEKRKVPTGSNPLHNKRWRLILKTTHFR